MCGPTCRKRSSRSALQTPGTIVARSPLPAPLSQSTDAGAVEATALGVLAEVERENTPLGQAVLVLARKIDANRDTGAGLAALVKQFESTLRAATSGAHEDASGLDKARDELAARRELRSA